MADGPMPSAQREQWGSRIGLILAAAGNAVGIGNLLRFPGQAAQNGGGAFMIPYVVSLIVFGLPAMWIAWTIGRHGGRFGHGTLPGQFDRIWPARASKYFGVVGVALPLLFCLYYTYIEAWCLGYSFFSLTGDYVSTPERSVNLLVYLQEFLGDAPTHSYFSGETAAFVFLCITLLLNVWVLYRGVAKGIELLAKIAMPLLLLFCIVLAVRVFTLGEIKGTAVDGLKFLWTPDFSKLLSPSVWIAAAGQIFFTLSIGFGSMECYASYLKDNDDVALTGLTTASTNEFVEIIFGSMIAIPAAAIFFGGEKIGEIASGGTFYIGMISMPEVLRNTAGLEVFGTLWFLLLFFAAFTSSVAVAQPVVAFLQDEFKLKREASAILIGFFWFLGTLPIIFFYKYGVLDEMDFWAGTIGLVITALLEVVLFAWIWGMKRGWDELHRGADMRVPGIFAFIMRYVTPVALLLVFGAWFWDAIAKDTLIPAPKINVGVAERSKYPGDFVRRAPPAEAKAEVDAIEKEIKAAVTSSSRDLNAWADVEIAADGNVKVLSYGADPVLRKIVGPERFERWLELQGWHYEEQKGTELVSAATTATLRIEALNRSPFIWVTRVIIIGVTLLFIGLIRAAWKDRAAPAGGAVA